MERVSETNILTKECILTALLRLMEVKSYASISITDITNLAGVSRMAYYRNYKNKDEILIKYLVEQESKLLKELRGESATTLHGMIYYIAEFFQENVKVIKAVFDADLGHMLTDMLGDRINNYFPVVNASTSGKYAVQFYVSAVIGVFRMWFDNGMVETAEEISDILCDLINQDEAVQFLTIPEK
jgi:AcrR family transcriptional regulator